MNETVMHTIDPIYNKDSKILILGTMPSPKSREAGFYYAHPRNRFWETIAAVLNVETPSTVSEKKSLLYESGIALWDVLASCRISKADDGSIKDAFVNEFTTLFETADIKAVFTTGKKATALFGVHCEEKCMFTPIYLPSTSPANCRMSRLELISAYKVILGFI